MSEKEEEEKEESFSNLLRDLRESNIPKSKVKCLCGEEISVEKDVWAISLSFGVEFSLKTIFRFNTKNASFVLTSAVQLDNEREGGGGGEGGVLF